MRRYARLDPPEVGGEGEEGAPQPAPAYSDDARDPLVLPARCFGRLLPAEGFDFGVGSCCPFLGRSEADRRHVRVDRAGLGRQRGVARHRGRSHFPPSRSGTRRCSRAFTSPCCSSSCLLIVRVLSFEWREKAATPGWRAFWAWMNTIGWVGAPFCGGSRSPACCTASRSRPTRVRRRLRRPLQRLHDPCRDRLLPPLRAPRRGFPRVAHPRRLSRARPARGGEPRAGGGDRRGRLSVWTLVVATT